MELFNPEIKRELADCKKMQEGTDGLSQYNHLQDMETLRALMRVTEKAYKDYLGKWKYGDYIPYSH